MCMRKLRLRKIMSPSQGDKVLSDGIKFKLTVVIQCYIVSQYCSCDSWLIRNKRKTEGGSHRSLIQVARINSAVKKRVKNRHKNYKKTQPAAVT